MNNFIMELIDCLFLTIIIINPLTKFIMIILALFACIYIIIYYFTSAQGHMHHMDNYRLFLFANAYLYAWLLISLIIDILENII